MATDNYPPIQLGGKYVDLDGLHVAVDSGTISAYISGEQNTNRHAIIAPTNAVNTFEMVRLVGTGFENTTKDTNFWTESVTSSGTVVQAGNINLSTGATALGAASYTTVRKGRFIAAAANRFMGIFTFETALTANNVRRLGAYTSTDGFFFQANGTTFQVGTRKASSDTVISTGSFNGNYGTDWSPTAGTSYKFEIEYTPKGVFWYVDNILLHQKGTPGLVNTFTLPVSFETVNSGALDTPMVLISYVATMVREGKLHTNPTSKYILTGTSVLKYGPGVIRRIIVSDNIGGVIIYDNTAAAGTVITDLDTSQGSEPLGQVDFDIPFSNGLTIAITGDVGVTVVYE